MSTGQNKYYVRSHISEKLFRRLIRIFALDLTATEAAAVTGLSLRSVNTVYLKLRGQMARWCEAQNPLAGEVEVDESYFGPRRVRGKRGRGAGGKTIVFGIFQRNGYVYTQIVPDCRRKTLRKAILGRISLESVIHCFWSFAKRRLAKFNGIPAHTFALHLKETEFRFNHRRDNLYRVLLDQLRRDPLTGRLTS